MWKAVQVQKKMQTNVLQATAAKLNTRFLEFILQVYTNPPHELLEKIVFTNRKALSMRLAVDWKEKIVLTNRKSLYMRLAVGW